MTDWIIGVVEKLGYAGIALLTFLENLFPPIPSEVIMPLAGFHASKGDIHIAGAIAAGSLGSWAGAAAWYFIGLRIGERRLRRWVERHGHWLTLGNDDIDKARRQFQEHGGRVVFFGRLIPAVRTWISVPAGLEEMPKGPFLLYTALGSILWTTLLTLAGYWLGESFRNVQGPLGVVSTIVIAGLALLYVTRLVQGFRRRAESGVR